MTQVQADKILVAWMEAVVGNASESMFIIQAELENAVRRQVPQKMKHDNGKGSWTCPNCGTLLYNSKEFKGDVNDIFRYCPECGQRLDLEI